jgi:ribosomal protein L35
MKAKTHKSLAKRIKVTKNGKMLKRYGGQDHFNARESGNTVAKKRRDDQFSESFRVHVKRLMPYAGAHKKKK